LTKCFRGSDEMALWTGFSPRAGYSLEIPAAGYLQIFKEGYFSSSKH